MALQVLLPACTHTPPTTWLQFQRGVRRFYGFAAEGLLGRSAKPLRRPSVPKGMAGSGLAARGVIWQQLRTKATLAEGHIAGAAEVRAAEWGALLCCGAVRCDAGMQHQAGLEDCRGGLGCVFP